MKVFISWSGARSQAFAECLRETLPLVLQGIEAFVSAKDIEGGARWSPEIAASLADSDYGILCLTPENLDKPWLLFEAGALSKNAGSRACGLLLGDLSPSDVAGPLSQFQNREFNEQNWLRTLKEINARREGSQLDGEQVEKSHAAWWSSVEGGYEAAMATKYDDSAKSERSDRELLEETLDLVRRIIRAMPSGFKVEDQAAREAEARRRFRQLVIDKNLAGEQERKHTSDFIEAFLATKFGADASKAPPESASDDSPTSES